ncbi:MAG: cytochrome c oxidase assembly protein [Firmicutes bacterium]|nr:cytochrome c oxidase assembly protein [Bacillota bacterium]
MAHLGNLNLWHPEVILLIVLLAVLYRQGVQNPPNCQPGPTLTRSQNVAFALALAVLYVSIGSPLAAFSEVDNFAAYSLQMALMTMIFPRLLLYSVPVDRLSGWTDLPVFGAIWRALTHPPVAALAYNVIATLLLLPWSVDTLLIDNDAHAFGQMLLMFFSLCLWWPLSRGTRSAPSLRPGAQLLYILISFNLMMPVVVALLVTSDSTFHLPTWYRAFSHPSTLFHMTPTEGQTTGALILAAFMLASYGLRALQAWLQMRQARPVLPSV